MGDDPYKCLCHNKILGVNARFRCYDSDGKDAHEVTVPSGEKRHLKLVQETGNTVLVEYWDVNPQHNGCYSIDNGDHIVEDGASTGFAVTVNGGSPTKVPCPGS